MRKLPSSLLGTTFVLAASLVLVGCSGPNEQSQDGDEHHEGDGHDHGHPSHGPNGGDLIELGNEEYHAELLHPHSHDDDAHQHAGDNHEHAGITVNILDGSAKKSVAISANEISLNLTHDGKAEQFKLSARPSESDEPGKSSKFSSNDKHLLEHFHENEHVAGTIVIAIAGKSYRGKVTHDHEGHDHDDHEGHNH